jgi:ABC-type polysaccharide/polyol phosphate export permease
MTSGALLAPFRPIRRQHIALARQVASIHHGLLDQSTSLGYMWSFLHPLITLVVLYVFFRHRIGDGIDNYAIYLLVGLVQFTHFSKSTAGAMRILYKMRSLATSVIFPKDVLVYSSLLSDAPEFLISMGATVVIALLTGVHPSWALLGLPLLILMQFMLVLWLSMFLAMGYVFLRDLDHIHEVAMRLFFFVTPVFYSLSILPPRTREIAMLNPMAQLIGFGRSMILDGRFPPVSQLVVFSVVNLLLVYVAVIAFRRAEPALMEQL